MALPGIVAPVAVLAAGGLVLLAGIGNGFFATSSELEAMQRRQIQLADEFKTVEQDHAQTKAKKDTLDQELSDLQEAAQRLEGERAAAEQVFNEQKERNRQAIQPLLEEIASLRERSDVNKAELAKIQQQQQNQRRLSQWLEDHQNHVLSLYTSEKDLCSGFMVDNGRGRVILLTDAGVVPRETQFKGTFLPTGYRQPLLIDMHLHRFAGPLGSVAIITRPGVRFSAKGVRVFRRPDPVIGDKIYAIGNVQIGPFAVEYNVFDGTVSGLGVTVDNVRMHRTTLPANKGCSGSMVLDGEGMILGMMVVRDVGNGPETFLIPNTTITAALPNF